MTDKDTGGPAFPVDGTALQNETMGMTLRDYFAGQAMLNSDICTGRAREYQLKAWFGYRCEITREEIIAKQAYIYADAMIEARK